MSKRYLVPPPIRRKVMSDRNSECVVPLDSLDWSRWWTDTGFSDSGFLLKVPSRDSDSVHRVYCRGVYRPRLMMRDGKLYWLIDRAAQRDRRKP